MHVNILILMLYVVSNQMNILFYENMRNDIDKEMTIRHEIILVIRRRLSNPPPISIFGLKATHS